MKLPRWDQNDYRVANDSICMEATRLETTLRAAGKDVPPRPTEKANPVENYDVLAGHVAQLHALVSLSIAKPSAAPATPAPASTVAAPAQTVPAPKKLSPDEQLWALHGVKSADELNSKIDRERALGLHKDIGD